MEVILLITEFILKPVSEHNFLVKAISKLYMASTKDKSLFKKSKNKKVMKLKKLSTKYLNRFD